MYPIPALFLMLSDGSFEPLPPGSVKKIAFTREQLASATQRSMAILLNDGRLYTQGDNAWGECADGTTSPFYNYWHLASTNVADVFGVSKVFVVKYNNGGWQYAGYLPQLVGYGGSFMTTWTSFPSEITGTISLANLESVIGGGGNTLWLMNNGTLYGSGANRNGCLGTGNSNTVSTPISISSSCVRAFGMSACTSYLNNVGVPRVCGSDKGISGTTAGLTMYFVNVSFSGITEPVYVKEWLCNDTNTIAIASTSQEDMNHYLYSRAITSNSTTYVKVEGFGPFTEFKVIEGGQSRFFIADNVLYAMGELPPALGLGNGTGQVTTPTPIPVPTGEDWDLSKLTYIVDMKDDVLTYGAVYSHWMVYDGNLFYTGDPRAFFNSIATVTKFTNVPETSFEGIIADEITTGSIGIAIAGTTKQLTWSIDPPGAEIYDLQFTSSHPEYATVDEDGLMTFVAEGGFDITMTAKTGSGTNMKTLTDTSGGYASTMGMATDSLSAMVVGETKQLVYTVTPEGVENLDGYTITFSSEDPAVATVDETGLITAVADGGTRIHATAALQTVTADDSSYLAVNAA